MATILDISEKSCFVRMKAAYQIEMSVLWNTAVPLETITSFYKSHWIDILQSALDMDIPLFIIGNKSNCRMSCEVYSLVVFIVKHCFFLA